MESNENISTEKTLLIRYMTILFLLVSFLSILGLFLLSKIYWKDVAEIQKSSIVENVFCHNSVAVMYAKEVMLHY